MDDGAILHEDTAVIEEAWVGGLPGLDLLLPLPEITQARRVWRKSTKPSLKRKATACREGSAPSRDWMAAARSLKLGERCRHSSVRGASRLREWIFRDLLMKPESRTI